MNSLEILFFILTIVCKFQVSLGARGFIRAQGPIFVDADCRQYIANGWNSWQMIEAAMGITPVSLEQMMDIAVATNMNTFRAFAHGHDSSIMQLQYSPGSYNQDALIGLDKILHLASQRGLRVILSFADNWKSVDSKVNYMFWSGYGDWGDEFFYDEMAKQFYKDHVSYIVNRVNSITGTQYKNDPTIFAWNLINEPRSNNGDCDQNCMNTIQAWIDEMSAFLKSVDSNHMITIGEEGFFGWGSGKEGANPDAWNGDFGGWAMKSGQNFYNNHAGNNIDFAGIHIWVDNWGIYHDSYTFFKKWIEEHVGDAKAMNKPLLIEEFGKMAFSENEISSSRDPYFDLAYQTTISSIQNEGVIRGVMWWEWEGDNNANLEEYDVKTYHSTWNTQIKPKSAQIAELVDSLPPVEKCVPGELMSSTVA
eukprot:TRINITY_DN869_c0_g2_i1.p1 TRINITY_DN869_c0_g2~~TRINITY_DN869_c0_g2_i1.p1  ORF type:complete len:449 (-),score=72.10 TRINITY_DN869_c0_g2_i1:2142-3404(-)